jgi:hypothetical protein
LLKCGDDSEITAVGIADNGDVVAVQAEAICRWCPPNYTLERVPRSWDG